MFTGYMFEVPEINSRNLGQYVFLVEERMHKRPTHIMLNTAVDVKALQVEGVEIANRQYVHHKNIILVGVIE